jgi:hypothetical protein
MQQPLQDVYHRSREVTGCAHSGGGTPLTAEVFFSEEKRTA